MARGLKFWIQVEEGLYYPYSENKGADQLCSYCAADLVFVFAYAKSGFSNNEAHIDVAGSKTLTWEVKYTVCVTHVFVL